MLCVHIDEIMLSNLNAVIILAGDFNKLDCSKFEVDQGMTQLVNQATHGNSVLDKCFTNRPDLYSSVSVISSLIDTKHKAVLVEGRNSVNLQNGDSNNKNAARKFVIYNRSPESIGRLREAFSLYSWSGLINAILTAEQLMSVQHLMIFVLLLNGI